jgi:hypothetical protein
MLIFCRLQPLGAAAATGIEVKVLNPLVSIINLTAMQQQLHCYSCSKHARISQTRGDGQFASVCGASVDV